MITLRTAFGGLVASVLRSPWAWWMLLVTGTAFGGPVARAEQIFQLRNGMVLRGLMAEVPTLKEGFGAAAAGQANVSPIWLIDDGLRRVYIHGKGMTQGNPIDVADPTQGIDLWQPTPLGGKAVAGLGSILAVSPFNEYGRRLLTMRGPEGPVNVVQGIKELNSRYTKLSALKGNPSLLWDMRVATASIDSATLKRIFDRRIPADDLDAKLQTVRFFQDAKRFDDAKEALSAIEPFPADIDRDAMLIALTEQQAGQLLDEAKVRAAAGQYQLARGILSNFPTQAVGRITRIQVQDELKKLDDSAGEAAALSQLLRDHVAKLVPAQAEPLAGIVDEISQGLSPDTLSRLSDFSRLGKSEDVALDDRVALAIAGWLLGSGSGEQNLSVATALIKVRDLVAEYLGPADPLRRQAILETLATLEGAQPEYVDRMLPLLAPPLDWPAGSAVEGVDGFYSVDTERARYAIQLPPEYNPLRSYPCVLALHGAGGYAEDEIDWWAGAVRPDQVASQPAQQNGEPVLQDRQPTKSRLGHASRNGFIVVAPVWSRTGQAVYEYTPQEHERVLAAMRDAMRRASIDSDRIYISGHGEGGTAAWDMALAHPDLWAGMIPISGSPSKTVHHFELNARYLPMYIVMGELDAVRADGSIMDDYMSFNHDAMVVMYRGRGREPFFDEIPRLFEWMQSPAHRRRDPPQEIAVSTMRAGDQFFWWLELNDLKPDVQIDPILWSTASRIRSGKVNASIGTGNQVRISGPAERFTVMFRPQPGIDMADEIVVRAGNRPYRFQFDGSLEVLLEDARRRADRKRAFWFRATIP
ncbi:Alpha/beta hydrolase family protein [Rubripirellula lacrimiformis]|uniref:Alpha/beta hydrolase family protein n=1 Tax=Rubripirellula lacrimiformis TaxID=1930273 RepID=A0A517N6D8_9BACT|nr:alpha/beta hydrolase [Rubripirellula lacrimiformis]QDT02704.1 Alpha/beta hydrolase family protein [Rubripirellula lacrimiformis]